MDKIVAAIVAFFSSFFIKPAMVATPLPTLLPTPTPIAIILQVVSGNTLVNGATPSGNQVRIGDLVETKEKAVAVLDYQEGMAVRLAPMTKLQITNPNKILQSLGSIYVRFKKILGIRDQFEVETPQALATVRGSAFASFIPNKFYVTDDQIEIKIGIVSAILTASQSAKTKLNFEEQNWIDLNKLENITASDTAKILFRPPPPTPTPVPSTPVPVPVLSGPPGTGLSTVMVSTEKGNFRATILSVDLSTSRMITDSSSDSDCSNDCPATNLASFVSKNGGFAGVNGTYFCPDTYPDCQSKKNAFDFPIYVTRLSKWAQGDKLGWSERRAILYTDGSGAHYQNSSAGFGGGLNAGIINYPGLVDNGNVQIDDGQGGLSDKQKMKGTKVGIGTRNTNNILVVVGYNVNMLEFAHIFKSLGAKGALNLDTGGSTALYYNGSYVLGPGRNLPNAIIFTRK